MKIFNLKKNDMVIFLKLKNHKLFSNYEGSFQKKILPDKLGTLQTLQKVFSSSENSSEISRKFENFSILGNIWMVPKLLYFLEIWSISGKSTE